MANETVSFPVFAPTAPSRRVRWSVARYENLFQMGLLEPESCELIEGNIVKKTPIPFTHSWIQTVLLFLLARLFGQEFVLLPISLQIGEYSLPEPDMVVTVHPVTTYRTRRYLLPEDVRVVVEVSDATLSDYLRTKADLYARADISEYWVVDVVGQRLVLHSIPTDSGYQSVTVYTHIDTVISSVLPDTPFPVNALFGEETAE